MHGKKNFLLLPIALLLASAGAAGAQGSPCLIGAPGYSYCAGNVTFSGYNPSVPFRPFQSDQGSGVQRNITVTFNPWVKALRIWANDPDATAKVDYYIAGAGYVATFNITGDGRPCVFSYGFLGLGPGDHFITRIVLRPDPSDYVNWNVEYQKGSINTNNWCRITSASVNCDGATVTTSPFYQGSGFDPFQAGTGTGEQPPIDISFQIPLYSVQVTAVDPDYGGTRMEAFLADGTPLPAVYFDGDNRPGFQTRSTKSVTDSRGIARIVLTSATGDYVVFQGLTGTPF